MLARNEGVLSAEILLLPIPYNIASENKMSFATTACVCNVVKSKYCATTRRYMLPTQEAGWCVFSHLVRCLKFQKTQKDLSRKRKYTNSLCVELAHRLANRKAGDGI